jgi:hypothetical protein
MSNFLGADNEDKTDDEIPERTLTKKEKTELQTKRFARRASGTQYYDYRDLSTLKWHALFESPILFGIGTVLLITLTLLIWIYLYSADFEYWYILAGGAFLTIIWIYSTTMYNRKRLGNAWEQMHNNIYNAIRERVENDPAKYLVGYTPDNKLDSDGTPLQLEFLFKDYLNRYKNKQFTKEAEDYIESQKERNKEQYNELSRHRSMLGTLKTFGKKTIEKAVDMFLPV